MSARGSRHGRSRVAALALAGACALVWALASAPAARASVTTEARVSRNTLIVGETTTLEVWVRGTASGISDPDLGTPPEVEVLGSARSQNFSWINGKSSIETVFRYELSPTRAGRFAIGPIHVRIGGQDYMSPAIELTVTAASTRIGSSGQGPASLIVDVSPREPYVGQPVILRVRLVQRAALVEDPQYTPPPTPGFWAERYRDPESYYADEGNQRVLVTEARARLFPLAAGTATVGEAIASLALATGGAGNDPLQWLGGGARRREVVVRSEPQTVRVRALPGGAPDGFDGAVGGLQLAWSADRARTSQDVPFTLRLEVRGVGNLRLLHTPRLENSDIEVFPATVEDSAGAPGELGSGRRRFQWTVLARHAGRLSIPPPPFSWFDPASGAYRTNQPPPVEIEVGPALFSTQNGGESFPEVFASNPVDPGAGRAVPWAWAFAGLAVGGGIALWRASLRAPADAGPRARQREWLRVIGLARGRDFWQAADEASAWLAERGVSVAGLRRDIDAARFSGSSTGDLERLRPRLVEQLSRALPPATPRWPLRVAAAVLMLAGAVTCVLFGPRPGDPAGTLAAQQADAAARSGDLARAQSGWETLWRQRPDAGLAARLAWAEIRAGNVGRAALWTVRGMDNDPRDPSVGWVAARVREGGGLEGGVSGRLPVRALEWAIAAFAFGVLAGACWPRAGLAGAFVLLALAVAAVPIAEVWRAQRAARAVVLYDVKLAGPDLQLSPGQVVRVVRRAGEQREVRLGRDIVGTVPARALGEIEGAL